MQFFISFEETDKDSKEEQRLKKILRMTMSLFFAFVFMSMGFTFPVNAAEDVVTTWTGTAGDLYRYQQHTKGDGIPIIIMPVHFGPDDLAADGKLQTASTWAAEAVLDDANRFFSDFKDYLDVYVYIQSEDVYPVPTEGYVDSFWEKMETATQLTKDKLGKDPSMMRIVYLGNSDGAGQVGGWAYGRAGAMLSWGNNADGQPWQNDAAYWSRHEFWGHGFAGFADEYFMESAGGEDVNFVVSETKPSNASVPWYEFLGLKETDESGNEHEIGIYSYDGYTGWFPSSEGFMHSASTYISSYHKWVVYEQAMEYAGTPTTLEAFCQMQGITLNPPEPDSELGALEYHARVGGSYQLKEDVDFGNSPFVIQEDFTLDLNGHSVKVDYSASSVHDTYLSAVTIASGKTFTIDDTAGGGEFTATCGSGAGISTLGATLVVDGGTLDITGGDWSSAIGSRQGANGTVIINGGYVTATASANQSAGIGGGSGGSGGSITINGGTVVTTGSANNSNADIGNGTGGSGGSITITGGSLNPTRNLVSPTPTDGNGTSLYRTVVTLDGFPNTDVTSITTTTQARSQASYGATDLRTDANGDLYLWLPEGATEITVKARGIDFTSPVTVAANNNNAVTPTPSAGSQIAPSITRQPSNVSAREGSSATFTVSGSGYPTPGYQWQISTDNGGSWTNISGATSNSYTVSGVTISGHNGNQYRCVVSNTLGSVTSSAATLTVTEGSLPNTDAEDMRNVYMLIFFISAAVLGAALIHKRKEASY